jgi:Delta3-Delta2-enoyl-CoA isomerase
MIPVETIERQMRDGVSVLRIRRGKVNALNGTVVSELRQCVSDAERSDSTRAIVLTGTGKFFSFGFDIPEFLPCPREEFAAFVTGFAALYREIFALSKPTVAAVNGHAVAGGCMLALACDHRVMAADRGTIGLNEVQFGSSVFAGSVEMLRFWVGEATASKVLLSGSRFAAVEAWSMGLVDEAVPSDDVEATACARAAERGRSYQPAYGALKRLLREPVLDEIDRREAESIARFVSIWYSPETRRQLEQIVIR